MNAFTKAAEMSNHKKYIELAGYEVRMMQDGTLEVKDPYHLNGKANAGFDIVNLRSARAASKFISDRS